MDSLTTILSTELTFTSKLKPNKSNVYDYGTNDNLMREDKVTTSKRHPNFEKIDLPYLNHFCIVDSPDIGSKALKEKMG